MGLRSRTLACAATRTRQTQCLQHPSGLYRSHGRVVGDPEVMRRNLSLRIIANALIETWLYGFVLAHLTSLYTVVNRARISSEARSRLFWCLSS
jgi:hypothetical protein